MGAGVQTTAMLIKYWERYSEVIFADTRDEQDETYEYIGRYMLPFCRKHNLPWVTVHELHSRSVMENAERAKSPEHFFRLRQCTRDNKIKPIHRHIRALKPRPTSKDPVIQDIGFSLDEIHRIGANPRPDDPDYTLKEFPLLDDKITRQGCKDIITAYGWPVPPESHCKVCPLLPNKKFRAARNKFPKDFARLVKIEKQDKKYPKRTIRQGHPLDKMVLSRSLDDFGCDSGHCFL